ncbi:MAG: hypothetical protein JNJ49_08555 [Bdellovibrionaceae bacterium]|nr:hypothetical protein [Pseudobdellovibrionaceae bacterium]
MKKTRKTKRERRNAMSYPCVEQFHKFIESLGDDIIIVTMNCKLTSFDCGALITAKLAKPIFNLEDDCLEDYQHGDFLMKWDKNGKLIKASKDFSWEG